MSAARRLRNLSVVTTVATYLTILLGGFTRGSGAGLGCGDNWPRCTETSFFPPWGDRLAVIEWNHRLVALVAGLLILWTAVQAWRTVRHDKRVLAAATVAAVLLPVQAYLGALVVWHHLNPWLSATHMGTAAALFGAVVATAIFASYPRKAAPAPGGAGVTERAPDEPVGEEGASLADYASMMKPRIMLLLSVMAVAGIALAAGSVEISLAQAFWTVLGGALAAGGAGAINQVLERDVDARMDRTRERPLVTGRIDPGDALTFALVLIAVSFTMVAFMVNVLAAVLTMVAVLVYVFIYTSWLKPTSPQGVVVGGFAGAMPALVGWAGVTGDIGLPALLLGLVVFLWQPPHFWALAMARKDEYQRAGFPMLPVVHSRARTRRRMVGYTLATLVAAAAFYWLGYLGQVYLVASTLLGIAFLAATLRVTGEAGDLQSRARGLFWMSIAYLGLLFAAVVVDRVIYVLA